MRHRVCKIDARVLRIAPIRLEHVKIIAATELPPKLHLLVVKRREKMIKNLRIRRTSAAIMVLLGAVLMLIAPEIWSGLLLLVLGVVLELAGIALGHKISKAP